MSIEVVVSLLAAIGLGGILGAYFHSRFQHRKEVEDVKEEVKTEMLNSIVFANDEVIKAMSEFVKSPSDATYIKTASAMRKDLWGKDTKIGEGILKTFGKGES